MSENRRNSFDDLNWGRLNLVSAQDQVAEQHSWRVTYQQGDRVVRVSCRALPESGVPHGVDNDVSSALLDYYMSIGLPADGEMNIAVSDLLQLAGFHRNGKYRDMLNTSLDRLHTTSYEIAGGWRDHPNRRWITAKFHFIELLEYTHQGESGKFDERSMLRIRLAEPLVASLRSGYTKPLNIDFMQSLSRPRTRIIFRLLDAMRYNPENPDEIIDEYEVGLIELADQCKLPNNRPDSIRRSLEAPHAELLKRGYLHKITLTGRGKDQRIHYEFSPEFTPISPNLLQKLRKHGVTDGVSRQLARQFTASVLLSRIEQFEHLVQTGTLQIKKTAAHALVHLITHPDRYPDLRTSKPVIQITRSPQAARPEPEVEPPNWAKEFSAMSPDEMASFVIKRLNLLYVKKFSTFELDTIRHFLLTDELHPVQFIEEAYKRLAQLDAQAFIDDLKAKIKGKVTEPVSPPLPEPHTSK